MFYEQIPENLTPFQLALEPDQYTSWLTFSADIGLSRIHQYQCIYVVNISRYGNFLVLKNTMQKNYACGSL